MQRLDEDVSAVAERKRRERQRSREAGWHYVYVRVPPGVHKEVLELAALRRDEYLRRHGA